MMTAMRPVALASSLALVVVACGWSTPQPASPGPGTNDSASPPVASASSPPAEQAPPPPHHRPIDLTSACPHDVHLYFGAKPGDGTGESATVSSGQTIPVPRQPDGTNVVWVVDDKGFGLASVNITKSMRHVHIDAACLKIDADSNR